METLLQDVRFALRMLWKSPAVSLVAILALTAGIGANTAIFSVVNAVLLQPLPYAQPERLVNVWGGRVGEAHEQTSISYADFEDWRRDARSFSRIAAWNYQPSLLRLGGEQTPLRGTRASSDLLPALGIQPELGRFFTADEDKEGAASVVVISHDVWQTYLKGSPDVIGSTIVLDGRATEIVGVMPPTFVFPATWRKSDFVVPIEVTLAKQSRQRGNQSLKCVAQLREGVTPAQATAELDGLCRQLETAYPETNATRQAWLRQMHEDIVGDSKPALLILLGAVALVLLIACANVANLLFARATSRQRELSIRAALGASRGRIVRQLLVESFVLSVLGAGAGLLFAAWGLDALMRYSPGNIPRLSAAGLNTPVLVFTIVVAVVTTFVAGVAPALALSRPDVIDALKEGTRGSTEGAGARRTRSALVAVQFALSVMLLVGAGLLIRSFVQLRNVDPGFDAASVTTVPLAPSAANYAEEEARARYFREVLDATRAQAGVASAAVIAPLPFSGWEMSNSFAIEGRPTPPLGQEPISDYRTISPDYFATMRIPLRSGREFTDHDTHESAAVVIVNETFAKRYFPDQNPVGQHLQIGGDPDNPDVPMREIVGVVGDAYHQSLDEKPGPEYYVPYTQDTMDTINLVVRGSVTPDSLRDVVRGVNRTEYVQKAVPLSENLEASTSRYRFNTLLLGLFAVVALLLATVGIYGVMSYAVTRRTHEIGIRMALGASAAKIVREVVGQGIGMALVGTGVGLVGAFALCRALESLLFGVSATDLATFASVTGVLLAVAVLACLVPARWASRVDPMIALRSE